MAGEVGYQDKTRKSMIGVDLDEVTSSIRHSILIVDDDPDTVILLKQILLRGGFNVIGAMDGKEALEKVVRHNPDLILLDIMMPHMDGWETFNSIQNITEAPVIVISALGNKDQIVEGLRRGVDDYIPKPFYNPEVVERVRTVLRRAGKKAEINSLIFPEISLSIDLRMNQVMYHNHEVHLPPKEFSFLTLLAKNAPAIVTYETIGDVIWGSQSPGIRKRTNYMVYLLRQRFEEIEPGVEIIKNIDRVGYKLITDFGS